MISIGSWQFDFSGPWLVLLSLLLLFSLLLSLRAVIRRLYRRNPLRMLTVALLNVLAYIAVYLLLLEPRLINDTEQALYLLTEGADPANSHLDNSARVYVAPGFDTSADNLEHLEAVNWLLDVEQLKLREPALSEIEVHGYGLSHEQWRHFPNYLQVHFNPPPNNGFINMQWQRFLYEGESVQISGRYQQDNNDSIVQLRLLDPAANIVDEKRLKGSQNFRLSTTVKTRGNLEYSLQAWIGDVLESEQPVPLEAGSGPGLNLMIEQSAPSFETRQLQNHAAAMGHQIRINTEISKGKSISQSANLPVDTDTTFSPEILAEQDLLIIDGRALVDLTEGRKQWLSDAIDNGLGLLVLADSALLENFSKLETSVLNGFQLSPLSDADPVVTPRLRTDISTNWQEPLTIAAIQLNADNADILIDDGKNRNLVIRRARGLGNIAISLIGHSHNWLTAGHSGDWGAYWSTLLSTLSRQPSGSFLLPQAGMDFLRVNQRIQVCAFSSETAANLAISSGADSGPTNLIELKLAADEMNSPRRCAYFWSDTGGWHRLQLVSVSNGSVLDQKSVYVFNASQWQAQQREQRVQSTLAMAINTATLSPSAEAKRVPRPMAPFWPWLILVLTGSLLWLERKLDFG